MKKITLPITIITSLTLAGCATTNTPSMEQRSVDQVSGTTKIVSVLAPPEINQVMNADDKAKLQQLVITAPTHQKTNWQGNGKFEFESLKIFVNEGGQGCRRYKISGEWGSFLARSAKSAEMTACRDDDGSWKLTA